MGVMGGIQQQGMQDAAAMERTKLDLSGRENVAKIGIQPSMLEAQTNARTPFGGMKLGIGANPSGGINPNKPTTLKDLFADWAKNQKV